MKVDFSISDYLEKGMYQTKEEIFSRYGFDLKKASEWKEGANTVLETNETVSLGEKEVTLQFYFIEDSCKMLKYHISLPEIDTITAAYGALASQTEILRDQLIPFCNFDGVDEKYTCFPDDSFKSLEDLIDAVTGKEVYNYFWSWILNAYDENEKVWADLMLWLPENGVGAYVEFRVYYVDRGLMDS